MTGSTRNKLEIEAPAGEAIIRMSRDFDFPRELVWRAYTEEAHIKQWWGSPEYDNTVQDFDFRDGGKWGIESASKDGTEVHRFHGVFSGIKPIDEFTWTFGYADYPAVPEAFRFIDLGGGRTRIEAVSTYPDVAGRDGMLEAMEPGASASYDRLDDVLARIAA